MEKSDHLPDDSRALIYAIVSRYIKKSLSWHFTIFIKIKKKC